MRTFIICAALLAAFVPCTVGKGDITSTGVPTTMTGSAIGYDNSILIQADIDPMENPDAIEVELYALLAQLFPDLLEEIAAIIINDDNIVVVFQPTVDPDNIQLAADNEQLAGLLNAIPGISNADPSSTFSDIDDLGLTTSQGKIIVTINFCDETSAKSGKSKSAKSVSGKSMKSGKSTYNRMRRSKSSKKSSSKGGSSGAVCVPRMTESGAQTVKTKGNKKKKNKKKGGGESSAMVMLKNVNPTYFVPAFLVAGVAFSVGGMFLLTAIKKHKQTILERKEFSEISESTPLLL